MTKTLARRNSKVIVTAVRNESYSGARSTWTASLVLRTDMSDHGDPEARINCGHTQHQTTQAAVDCGTKAWKRLPLG